MTARVIATPCCSAVISVSVAASARSRLLAAGVGDRRAAGEGLRELHPLARVLPGDHEAGVVDQPTLRDHEAEVERAAFDPIRRIRRAPGPAVAVGPAQRDV